MGSVIPEPIKGRVFTRNLLEFNRLLVGSPVLLAAGMYGLWSDASWRGEMEHLQMNLLSLSGYELLLIVGAVWLASRKLWYDALLLAGRDALPLFVPSVLLSTASWLDAHVGPAIIALCASAGVATIAKFALLKWRLRGLILPRSLIVIAGECADARSWYFQAALCLVAPFLVVLGAALPIRHEDRSRLCSHAGIPLVFHAFWCGVTFLISGRSATSMARIFHGHCCCLPAGCSACCSTIAGNNSVTNNGHHLHGWLSCRSWSGAAHSAAPMPFLSSP